ncbi:hypothetical protein HAX54_024779 [Datura stramonium]|uniref:Uncharacterized protein n=1 Tax=Datura stramonium TaxID=4076 RepID=A0ABS8V0H5_DATST|nr:hypothetical protein [Datura stramonium]
MEFLEGGELRGFLEGGEITGSLFGGGELHGVSWEGGGEIAGVSSKVVGCPVGGGEPQDFFGGELPREGGEIRKSPKKSELFIRIFDLRMNIKSRCIVKEVSSQGESWSKKQDKTKEEKTKM